MFRRTLRTKELPRDVNLLASHNDDLLAVEELLGDCAGETALEMTFAVNDDLVRKESWLALYLLCGFAWHR